MTFKAPIMDADSEEWDRLANDLARSLVQIKPCRYCGRPVHDGYCCGHCGSNCP